MVYWEAPNKELFVVWSHSPFWYENAFSAIVWHGVDVFIWARSCLLMSVLFVRFYPEHVLNFEVAGGDWHTDFCLW